MLALGIVIAACALVMIWVSDASTPVKWVVAELVMLAVGVAAVVLDRVLP